MLRIGEIYRRCSASGQQFMRASAGGRAMGYAPHGHWKVATFVLGPRSTGIVAPMLLDCPMNSAIFCQYVAQCLVPELRPGDIVVLDNLSSHKASGVREMIEAAGAELRFLASKSDFAFKRRSSTRAERAPA